MQTYIVHLNIQEYRIFQMTYNFPFIKVPSSNMETPREHNAQSGIHNTTIENVKVSFNYLNDVE